MNCTECKFFVYYKIAEKGIDGICMRYPQHAGVLDPVTNWCGEWSAKAPPIETTRNPQSAVKVSNGKKRRTAKVA